MNGLSKSASLNPQARRSERCGARASPFFTVSERILTISGKRSIKNSLPIDPYEFVNRLQYAVTSYYTTNYMPWKGFQARGKIFDLTPGPNSEGVKDGTSEKSNRCRSVPVHFSCGNLRALEQIQNGCGVFLGKNSDQRERMHTGPIRKLL